MWLGSKCHPRLQNHLFVKGDIVGNICTTISVIKCLTAIERALLGDNVAKFGP